jgi:hypothetical protein
VRRFASLKWRPAAAVVFCGVLGTLLPAAYGTAAGVRVPQVHDEFSYLLGADTFLRGRLTNPTPKLAEFFEAPHILVEPTYTSKFPPGQSMALAFGQVALSHPIWGVWFGCGLYAAALCWMLQAWTTKPWALAVSVATIVTLGVSTYWAQSYWGGMLAAGGSALVFGGIKRIWRTPRVVPSALTGLGALILANTRMYEGLLVCIPAFAVMAWWFVRSGSPPRRTRLRFGIAPAATVVLMGAACMASYNRAVTGDWSRAPYQIHQNQYFNQGVFLFSPARAPDRKPAPRVASLYQAYNSPPLKGRQLIARIASNGYERLSGAIESALGAVDYRREPARPILMWTFAFVLTVMMSAWRPWLWFLVSTTLFVVLGQSLVWWWFPHYSAPVVPLVLAAVALLLRSVAGSAPVWRARRFAPAALVVLAALSAATDLKIPASAKPSRPTRIDVLAYLEKQPGSHLVFVTYDDEVSPHEEWVWNRAEMESSRVIFAHHLGDTKNPELVAAYPGRSVWLVSVSSSDAGLKPYSPQRHQ